MRLRITLDTDNLYGPKEHDISQMVLPEGVEVELTLPVRVSVSVQQELYVHEAKYAAEKALSALCVSARKDLSALGVRDDDAGRVVDISMHDEP